MNRSGLWDETDGFFYDALRLQDGTTVAIKVHSMVGLIPLMPSALVPARIVERGAALGKRFSRFIETMNVSDENLRLGGFITGKPGAETFQLSVVPPARLEQLLREMLAEDAFLSPHGLRALSQRHRDQPFRLEAGGLTAQVDYEPGESTSGLFGGNSNWRGPVWFPMNFLAIMSLRNWDQWQGADYTVEYPTGSARGCASATCRTTSPAVLSRSGCPTPTAGARSTARTRSSRPIRNGATCSSSTSTSTVTPGPASGHRTRPAGPGS